MEQKSKYIGTTEYLVTQMDAVSALKVQTKLIKVLGPGIIPLLDKIETLKTPDAAKAILLKSLPDLVTNLLSNFEDEIVNGLVLSLFAKGVMHKQDDVPKVVEFATHFVGKPMLMWKVMLFILEANFFMGESVGSSSPTTKKVNLTPES